MTTIQANFSRRSLLKAGGALVVSVGAPMSLELARSAEEARVTGAQPPLTPDQLSSYIAVNADGRFPPLPAKWTWGRDFRSPCGKLWLKNSTLPIPQSSSSSATPTAVSIRAAPQSQ
jgi:hypothetical protein